MLIKTKILRQATINDGGEHFHIFILFYISSFSISNPLTQFKRKASFGKFN